MKRLLHFSIKSVYFLSKNSIKTPGYPYDIPVFQLVNRTGKIFVFQKNYPGKRPPQFPGIYVVFSTNISLLLFNCILME